MPAIANRPYTDFPADYTTLPAVSFVVPNLDDDSHDGTVDASDQWLEDHFAGYVQWAKTHNSLLIVTYDEGDLSDATNHSITIFSGAKVTTGQYSNTINHYNVLRTIEDAYGLSPLANAASAAPIDYIWNAATVSLAAPGNVAAKAVSGTQVNLTWSDSNTTETGYKIERSTDGTNFYALAGTGANGTGYNNTGLTAGKKYYYRIYAVGAAAAKSAFSAVVSAVTLTGTPPTTPGAPSSLATAANGSATINLTWADNSSNETAFRIERSTNGTSFTLLTTVAANIKTYSNSGLVAATKYYYRVLAVGATSNSGYSNVASATTGTVAQGDTLAAPSNLTARTSASVANAIDLFWTDTATTETGYKIERSTDGVSFYALAGTGANGAYYRNIGLTKGKKYYYPRLCGGCDTSLGVQQCRQPGALIDAGRTWPAAAAGNSHDARNRGALAV